MRWNAAPRLPVIDYAAILTDVALRNSVARRKLSDAYLILGTRMLEIGLSEEDVLRVSAPLLAVQKELSESGYLLSKARLDGGKPSRVVVLEIEAAK